VEIATHDLRLILAAAPMITRRKKPNPGRERKLSGALPQGASLLPKASYPFLLPASAKLPAEAETVRSPPPTNPSEEAAAYRGSDSNPPEECSKRVEDEGGRTVTVDSLRHENKR
jgi:hypothetical protein